MKTLDRYILKQFLINYIILFAVLMMLIITLDLIINIDEFTRVADRAEDGTAAEKIGVVLWAIGDFYGPQIFMFYVYAAGVLPIAAAGFTLAALTRHRELVAMLAGGISLYRVAVPLLLAGCGLSALVLLNQELVIPELREKLVRSHRHVRYGDIRPFSIEFLPDVADTNGDGADDHNLLFYSTEYDHQSRTMDRLTVLRRDSRGRPIEKITANRATWDTQRHGWLLIAGLSTQQSTIEEGGIITRRESEPQPITFLESWLDPASLMMHHRSRMRQMLSLREMGELLDRGGRIIPAEELQRLRHARFSSMTINVLILAMGLPFFLVRGPVNMLQASVKAAPLCLGAWAGSFIMMQIGGGGLPPALSAWLPTVMYLPVALFMLDRIET